MTPSRPWTDRLFFAGLVALGSSYVVLILLMLAADVAYTSWSHFFAVLRSDDIQYSIRLTMLTCTIAAILSVWVGTPLGYLLSRFHFRGRNLLDAILDIPIVLPPLVIGLSLLILFYIRPVAGGTNLDEFLRKNFQYKVPSHISAVILAQFAVACAFAARTMRITFDGINPRTELVALTLGCSRGRAFFEIVLPQAWRGVLTAFTMAWARSLGEFGPILVFAGTIRQRTEVLSTSVFLELSNGHLESAVAVSLLMVGIAVVVLVVLRSIGRGAGT